MVNENFVNLTFPGENRLRVDRSKCGFRVINQVNAAKADLSHQIREFHCFKSILDFKRKVTLN